MTYELHSIPLTSPLDLPGSPAQRLLRLLPRRLLRTERLSARRLVRVRVGLRVRVGVMAARVRSTAARVRVIAVRGCLGRPARRGVGPG